MNKDSIRIFPALLWKELRQAFKCGVLGLVLMTILLIAGVKAFLSTIAAMGLDGSNDIMSIFNATATGMPLVAALIALRQILFEILPDSWGFLIHRPASRTVLFWGKAAAGALLYTGAVVLPLAGALIWIAMPGHVPLPFDWRMALPGAADFLGGLVFYFAALLFGMPGARWSRLFVVGAGILCAVAVNMAPAFSQALLYSAAGLIVMIAAAWGSFRAGGRYETQSGASRLAAGLIVGAGLIFVIMAAARLVSSFSPDPARSARFIAYAVTGDGQILQTIREGFSSMGENIEINDLQGRPIDGYKGPAALEKLTAGVSTYELFIEPQVEQRFFRKDVYRRPNDIFTVLNSNESSVWCYVHRLGLIAIYEKESARLIGWMGPDGFTAGQARPVRAFDGPLIPSNFYYEVLAFPDAVYLVEFAQRRIEKLFQSPRGESVIAASHRFRNQRSVRPQFDLDVIVTTSNVYLQSWDGTRQFMAPRDPRAAGYGTLVVHRAAQAPVAVTHLLYSPTMGTLPNEEWMKLPWLDTAFDKGGAVVAQRTLPPPGPREEEHPSWARIAVPSLLTPVTMPAVLAVANLGLRSMGLFGSASDFGNLDLASRMFVWILRTLASVVSAAAAYRLARAYAFPRGRLSWWAALGLLLGPFAVALMLALVEWPARESCPACRRKRIVTREHCEHCTSSFNPPPLDGTEIFEHS